MNKKTIEEKYEFREIHADEADQVAQIELACFPSNEACKPEIMKERVKIFPEIYNKSKDEPVIKTLCRTA